MRNYKSINPKYWSGKTNMEVIETLAESTLYIYLQTCTYNEQLGIFELPSLKTISFETRIPYEEVEQALTSLEEKELILWDKEYNEIALPVMLLDNTPRKKPQGKIGLNIYFTNEVRTLKSRKTKDFIIKKTKGKRPDYPYLDLVIIPLLEITDYELLMSKLNEIELFVKDKEVMKDSKGKPLDQMVAFNRIILNKPGEINSAEKKKNKKGRMYSSDNASYNLEEYAEKSLFD